MSNQQVDSYYITEMIKKVCLINTYLGYDAKEVHKSIISFDGKTLAVKNEKIDFDPNTQRIIGIVNNFETKFEDQSLGIYGMKLFPAVDIDKNKIIAYYESSRFKNKIFTKYTTLSRRLENNKKLVKLLEPKLSTMKPDSKSFKRTQKKLEDSKKLIANLEDKVKSLENEISNIKSNNINLSGSKINIKDKNEMKYYDFTTINSSVQYLANGKEVIDLNYFKNEKLLGGNLMQKVVKKFVIGSSTYELIIAIRPQTDDGYVNNIELSVNSGNKYYLMGAMRLDFTSLCEFLFSSNDKQVAFVKNNINKLMANFLNKGQDNTWYKDVNKNDFTTEHIYIDDTYKALSSCILYLLMLMFQPFDVSSTKNYTHHFYPLIVPKRKNMIDDKDYSYVSTFGLPNGEDELFTACVNTIMYNSTFNPIFIKNSMNDYFKINFNKLKKEIPGAKPADRNKLKKRKIIYGRLGRMSSQVSYTNSIHSVNGTIAFDPKSRRHRVKKNKNGPAAKKAE